MKHAAVIVLLVLSVGCAPSKAEQAFDACQRHMAAQAFSSAVSACEIAVSLDVENRLYRTTLSDARLEVLKQKMQASVDAAREDARETRAILMELNAARQARAAEDLAQAARESPRPH